MEMKCGIGSMDKKNGGFGECFYNVRHLLVFFTQTNMLF